MQKKRIFFGKLSQDRVPATVEEPIASHLFSLILAYIFTEQYTGKGLAEHLEVPLPYLLYRAQVRYEEDLRGLQEIRDALSPTTPQSARPSEDIISPENPTNATGRTASVTAHLSTSKLTSPLRVRARLNSLSNNPSRPKKASSSSTLTVQDPTKTHAPLIRPTSPLSPEEETDSEDEAAAKEEEADRKLEEQEALDRKLENLQKMMTNDTLGLVSSSRVKGKTREVDRGRMGQIISSRPPNSHHRRPSSRSTSQSVSSASSPQGSIPSIPSSPPPGSQPHSPITRHLSPGKSSSPPAVSPRSAHGLRYAPLVGRSVSEEGSNQGSQASSFSDISGQIFNNHPCSSPGSYRMVDASLSASALESALLSNIRGTGSRL